MKSTQILEPEKVNLREKTKATEELIDEEDLTQFIPVYLKWTLDWIPKMRTDINIEIEFPEDE